MKFFTTKTNCRKILIVCITALLFTVTGFSQTQTVTYNTGGTYTWTAPCGVTSVTVKCWGAGASGDYDNGGGGGGAYAQSTISVSPGTTYTIYVGRGGGTYYTGFFNVHYEGESSTFGGTAVVAEGAGRYGSNYLGGGRASNSTGTIKFSGGNGGYNTNQPAGAGGGGSAGSAGNGGNGNPPSGINGYVAGAGGSAGAGGGAAGGNGGGSGSGGFSGNLPGAGGGQGGNFTFGYGDGDGADGQVVITYTGVSNYCPISFNNTEPITNVNFALTGINYTSSSSTSSADYEQICSPSGNVTIGNSYSITAQGNTVGNYTDYFTVYIDWNQNGSFADAGESYNIGTIKNSTGSDGKLTSLSPYSITVPVGATLGTTKMRVVKNYNNYPGSSCGTFTYGQAEDYVINVSGSCQQPTGASATDGTNTSTSNLTICSGTSVTLMQTGGTLGPGQTWKWYTGTWGGTLVNSNTNTNAAYTPFPAPTATTTYYVRAEGGTCGTGGTGASIKVTVNTVGTIALALGSTASEPACVGTAITPIVYNIGGGAVSTSTTISWNPTPPAGLSLVTGTGKVTLQGTPTATGVYTYTITPGGNSPCSNTPVSVTGTITVTAPVASISYNGGSNLTFCSGAFSSYSPLFSGGTPTNYSISPGLPVGLSIDGSGVISGTYIGTLPLTSYTVTAYNSCGTPVTTTVKIKVSSGDMVFNVTPNGTQNVCQPPFSGIVIGLDGSENGVPYQLLLDGAVVANYTGTGSAFNFSSQSSAGTYTVRTNSACKTNMSGSLILNISPKPTTTFSYSNYSYCSGAGVSVTPTIGGSPNTGGTFSASGAASGTLVWFNNDNTTGIVDLALSTPDTYTIAYTIPSSGPCGNFTYTQTNKIVIKASPQLFNVIGGGGYCSGGTGSHIGLDGSQIGVNYQLYLGSNPVGSAVAGTGAMLDFGNQTTAGTYTVKAKWSSGAGCETAMTGTPNIVIYANPAVMVTPASATLCQGTVQALTATGVPVGSTPGSVSIASGTINLSVPDNDPDGAYSLLKVTGIPIGATITRVSILFNITQANKGKQLRINLKGPNGNVLNIAEKLGINSNGNFTGTEVASDGSLNISFGTVPYSNGPYLPQANLNVDGAVTVALNKSNSDQFSDLYGSSAASANGDWTLSARDVVDNNGNNLAKLNNWTITINYTTVSNPSNVTWSPVTDLYTDPGATVPYDGTTAVSTIYTKPSGASLNYLATANNGNGCTTSANAIITVNQSPKITMSANYCSPPAPSGKIRVTATSDISVISSSWTWSDGSTGTNNSTNSHIDVDLAGNYYATAKAPNGCTSTNGIKVAQELVENGDFEQGNYGFVTGYSYVDNTIQNGLYPEGTYTVNNNPNFNHDNFWGVDHTTANGTGNYLLINGTSNTTVWKQTVTVTPNTDYYFAAYAVSLNSVTPYANLQFKVNGTAIGTNTGALPAKTPDNNPGSWIRFYGSWNSGTNTTANIEIIDLENAAGGNDFGLDDISFSTLSTFLNLTSGNGTNHQSDLCANTAITPITYEIGSDGNFPVITNLPPGISTTWDGRNLKIYGTPTISGNYNYTITSTGCNPKSANGYINVLQAASTGTFTNADANSIISTCYNSSGPIAISGTVGALTWESSTDQTTWSPASQNYTNIQVPTYYRVTAQNGTGCTSVTSLPVLLAIHNYWTGTTDANWTTASNWSDKQNASFSSCNTVVIPAGTPYSPVLNAATSVPNIIIASGAKLNLNDKDLTISGTYSGMGTLTGSTSSSLILTGNTGTLHFTPNDYVNNKLTNNYLKALTVSNSSGQTAIIGDSLNIAAGSAGNYGTVIVNNGGTLNANGNLILKSNANGTAVVGQSAGKITGEVTVERYIPELRAWRFIAAPFAASTQTIHDAWQEGVNNYGLGAAYNQNPHPGFGTHITGNNYSNLGFDFNTTTNPSMRVWDSVANNWNAVEPPTISTGISSYKAYYLFVRGSRAVDLSAGQYAAADPTVLRMKGELNEKGIPLSINYTGAANNWIFVGNPYASPVDIKNLITHTNGIVPDMFWVWDPKLSNPSWGTVGAYVTYANGVMTPHGTGTSYPVSTSIIQSGQGFLLQRDNSSTVPALAFSQSDKVTAQSNVFGFMGTKQASKNLVFPVVYTNLLITGQEGLVLTDGVATAFGNDFSSAVDAADAKKSWGYYENIAEVRDNNMLSIEFRPQVKLTDTIFYKSYLRQIPYTFQIFTENINLMPLTRAWLVDKYLNTKTEINLHDTTLYSFTPNADVKSYLDRFMLVFNRQLSTTPVPVSKAENQANPNVTGIAATINDKETGVVIYPNPVSTNKTALRFINMDKGSYDITVYNTAGQKLARREILHSGGSSVYNLPIGTSWAEGVYTVGVINKETQKTINLKLVIGK